jgi:ABC-2 type transport system ATP-binding protein
MADPAIVAEGLGKRFGRVTALDGVDLELPAGGVLGMLGPNGAGKTTTVRILATLLKPDRGRAWVAGFDVTSNPASVRRLIGLSGQYAAVDPFLTGQENLVMIGRLYGLTRRQARRRTGDLIDALELASAAGRLVRTYSGGMRRRLDVAAGLLAAPPVLFLDEPTTGLDPRARNDLWDVLEHLVDGGATLLLTTQYLEEADRLADDIVVVDHGKVIARGDARSLKRQAGGDHLHVVCADRADVEAVAEIVGRFASGRPSIDDRAVTAPAEGGVEAIAQLAQALAEEDIALEDLGLRQPTLDDAFLTLTGAPAETFDDEEVAA